MRQINEQGFELGKRLEGRAGKAVLKAYRDGGGVPTIGFGHTAGVTMGQTCSEALAEKWFHDDLDIAARAVESGVKVPLNDNQFAALVLFVLNVGVAAFRSSTLLRLLNRSQYDAVPAQLMRWCKDRDPHSGKMETVPGLVNRRTAEVGLWSTPMPMPEAVAAWAPEPHLDATRRPVPPPAPAGVLATSTGRAQATALVAGGTAAATEVAKASFGDALRDILDQLQGVAYGVDILEKLLVFGTLALIAWTLWDRHRKLRESGQ